MSCSGEVDRPLRATGVKVCECGLVKQAECSFCGFTMQFAGTSARALAAWQVFGLHRRLPLAFYGAQWHPDAPDSESVEWLCCPACLAESGGPERISTYLNEPQAMHPVPAYTRAIAMDGSTVEEHTS